MSKFIHFFYQLRHQLAYTRRADEVASYQKFHFPVLDGLRFLAFLWVFVGHLPRPVPGIHSWQRTNWIGVDLFFVLSSFLITSLFLLEFKKSKKLSFSNFMRRRSLRILPLYYFVVFFGLVVFPLSGFKIGPTEGMGYADLLSMTPYILTLTSNLTLPYSGVNVGGVIGPLWSICVEFQFYILVGLIFWYVYNVYKGNKHRLLVCIGCSLYVITVITRIVMLYTGKQQYIYSNLFTRLDPFIVGCICAFLFNSLSSHKDKHIIGFILILLSYFMYRFAFKLPHPSVEDFSNIYIYTFTALASGLFILGMLLIPNTVSKPISNNLFVKLGGLTFGMYVVHSTMIDLVINFKNPIPAVNTFALVGLLSFLMTVGLSIILYEWLEKYFLRLKKNG